MQCTLYTVHCTLYSVHTERKTSFVMEWKGCPLFYMQHHPRGLAHAWRCRGCCFVQLLYRCNSQLVRPDLLHQRVEEGNIARRVGHQSIPTALKNWITFFFSLKKLVLALWLVRTEWWSIAIGWEETGPPDSSDICGRGWARLSNELYQAII